MFIQELGLFVFHIASFDDPDEARSHVALLPTGAEGSSARVVALRPPLSAWSADAAAAPPLVSRPRLASERFQEFFRASLRVIAFTSVRTSGKMSTQRNQNAGTVIFENIFELSFFKLDFFIDIK